jgi:hypothetical protein
MCVDITKFVVAEKNRFQRFEDFNAMDFKQFWNVTKK